MANNSFQIALNNAGASTSLGFKNVTQALCTIQDTLDALVSQKFPEFPANPTCFFILFVVYEIGTWFLSGRGKFELKACNEKLKSFCRSDEYQEILEWLKDEDSLKYQFNQVTKPLLKGTLEYRANRMTILTSFVLGVIIWCQTSQGGHQYQN